MRWNSWTLPSRCSRMEASAHARYMHHINHRCARMEPIGARHTSPPQVRTPYIVTHVRTHRLVPAHSNAQVHVRVYTHGARTPHTYTHMLAHTHTRTLSHTHARRARIDASLHERNTHEHALVCAHIEMAVHTRHTHDI